MTAPTTSQTIARAAARVPVRRLPLVSGLAWLDVLDAAGGRCECAGWCGHAHPRRRCERENTPTAPLHVIPARPDGHLVAVCATCHDHWATHTNDTHAEHTDADDASHGAAGAGVGDGR